MFCLTKKSIADLPGCNYDVMPITFRLKETSNCFKVLLRNPYYFVVNIFSIIFKLFSFIVTHSLTVLGVYCSSSIRHSNYKLTRHPPWVRAPQCPAVTVHDCREVQSGLSRARGRNRKSTVIKPVSHDLFVYRWWPTRQESEPATPPDRWGDWACHLVIWLYLILKRLWYNQDLLKWITFNNWLNIDIR